MDWARVRLPVGVGLFYLTLRMVLGVQYLLSNMPLRVNRPKCEAEQSPLCTVQYKKANTDCPVCGQLLSNKLSFLFLSKSYEGRRAYTSQETHNLINYTTEIQHALKSVLGRPTFNSASLRNKHVLLKLGN
jgi:hypothetical protein